MEEMLQVATIIIGIVLFISVIGIMIDGFKYIGTNAKHVAEVKANIVSHGMGVACAVIATITLEIIKVAEGIQNTSVMIAMNSFLATCVVASFIFGSVFMLVSILWEKRRKSIIERDVHETLVVAVEETMKNNNEIKPQEQAVVEMEKVLRIIQTRY